MARLQLIIPILLWAAWLQTPAESLAYFVDPLTGTAIYFAALLAVVLMMRLIARSVMRRTTAYHGGPVPRFHRAMSVARLSVLALSGFALFCLGYGDAVKAVVPTFGGRVESLQTFGSLIPTIVAWAGLIWTQYPLDRGVREQNALYAFEYGEPVHGVPTLGQYLSHAMRLQVGFTLVPLFGIWVMRDVLLNLLHVVNRHQASYAEVLVWLGASGSIYVLAPALLHRVLPTEPLPPSPLRDRLEAMCAKLKLRHRNILIWHTHHTLANAAVMGIVRQVRYVLLSDLLLETMTADQTEAVFAHEAGHVKKHHMLWYGAFMLLFFFGATVAEDALGKWVQTGHPQFNSWAQWLTPIGELAVFFAVFGMLSRSFERQADAFAAEALYRPATELEPGRDGVVVFNSALRQVARLNNMPLDADSFTRGRPWLGRVIGHLTHHAGTWLHGSIRSRTEHLASLHDKPAVAQRFDLQMLAVRCVLLTGMCASAAWMVVQIVHPR